MGSFVFQNIAKKQFQKLLYNSFNSKELKHIGAWVNQAFDLEKLADFPKGVDIPRATAADLTVNYFDEKGILDELISYILSLNTYKGRDIKLYNLTEFLNSLHSCGLKYNKESNRLEQCNTEGRGWGILVPEREYFLTCVSIDIVDSSKIVHTCKRELVEKTFNNFRSYVFRRIQKYNGRIWEWLGDGGMAVFHDREGISDAVLSSIDILINIILFNSMMNFIPQKISIRIGIHCGLLTYKDNFADITGDAKKQALIIEKDYTYPNEMTVSGAVMTDLEQNIKKNFYANKKTKLGQLYKFQYSIGSPD